MTLRLPDGYRLVERLHEAGVTAVVRAEGPDGAVIVKTPRSSDPSEHDVRRYAGEFRLLQHLDGRGAIRAVACSTHAPLALVLEDTPELVPLSRRLHDALDLSARLHLAVALGNALGELHRARVVHRDINPSNVLVGADTARWVDFDLACRWADSARADHIMGTPAYLAPEQSGRTSHQVDYRCDFYSLGATLYELFAGHPPFVADGESELLHAHLARAPEPIAELPPPLWAVIAKLLQKDPAARYQSCAGLLADLRTLAADPHRAFEVGAADVPEQLVRPAHPVGRTEAVLAVQGCFDAAAAGTPSAAVFAGPPGSGQSFFLDWAANLARGRGFAVVRLAPGPVTVADLEQALARARGIAAGTGLESRAPASTGAGETADEVERITQLLRPIADSATRPWAVVLETEGSPAVQATLTALLQRDGLSLAVLLGRRPTTSPDVLAIPHRFRALPPSDLDALVAAHLGDSAEASAAREACVTLVAQRSGGHPGAAARFLGELVQAGGLVRDPHTGAWTLVSEVADALPPAAAVLNNVCDWIRDQRGEPRRAFALAAVTREFYWDDISSVLAPRGHPGGSKPGDNTRSAVPSEDDPVAAAQAAGALLLRADGRLRWIDDSVRTAALTATPSPLDCAEWIRLCGERGIRLGDAVSMRALAAAAPHIRATRARADHRAEALTLGRFALLHEENLTAKAAAEAAVALLADDAWANARDASDAFEAYDLLARACLCLGQRAPAVEALYVVVAQAREPLRRAEAFHQLAEVTYAAEDLERSCEYCLRGLSELGFELPMHPSMPSVALSFFPLRGRFARLSDADVEALPPLADPGATLATRLFIRIYAAAFQAGNIPLFALCATTHARLAITRGLDAYSCAGFASMALLTRAITGDAVLAHRFATMAYAVAERFPSEAARAMIGTPCVSFAEMWVESPRHCDDRLAVSVRAGEAGSNLFWSGAAAMFQCMLAWVFGRPQQYLRDRIEQARELSNRNGDHILALWCDAYTAWGDALAGDPNAGSTLRELYGPGADHDNEMLASSAAVMDAWLGFVEEDPTRVDRALSHVSVELLMGSPVELLWLVLRIAQDCRRFPTLRWRARVAARVRIARGLAKLRRWRDWNPDTLGPFASFADAHWQLARGEVMAAAGTFSAAAEGARRGGNLFLVGAAAAEGVRLCQRAHQPQLAASFALDARSAFVGQGATALAEAIDAMCDTSVQAVVERGATLALEAAHRAAPVRTGRTTTRVQDELGFADAASLLGVAEQVSGERSLPDLVRTLMRAVVHTSGATAGTLILFDEGEPAVQAVATLDGANVDVQLDVDRRPRAWVPGTVLDAVIQAQNNALVLADARHEGDHTGDPFIVANACRSILALALRRAGTNVGALVLENRAASRVFSERRERLISMIAGQLALSLENARYFDRLESIVERRTAELSRANANLEQLFNGMQQAIIVVDPRGKIHGRVSAEAQRIFGDKLQGKSAFDVLTAGTFDGDVHAELLATGLEMAFAVAPHEFEDIAELLPDEIVGWANSERERILVCSYRPVVEDERVVQLMVLATDVTGARRKEREMAEASEAQARELERTRRIFAQGTHVFVDFLERSERRLAHAKVWLGGADESDAPRQVVFREVHTMKSEARIYGLNDLERGCHELEDLLSHPIEARSERATEAAMCVGDLVEHLGRARELLLRTSPLGEGALHQITVDRRTLRAFNTRAQALPQDQCDPELRELATALASRPFAEVMATVVDGAQQWAAQERKRVQVILEGGDVPVPPRLAQVLPSACTHLVRNSIHHGIEHADERETLGKSPIARITLRAEHDAAGGVFVVVEDDGRGIDRDALRAKAQSLGITVVAGQELQLIFADQLSTAQEVGSVAGRGVGMAAVAADLAAVDYRVVPHSERGRGTCFTLVPSTSAATAAA